MGLIRTKGSRFVLALLIATALPVVTSGFDVAPALAKKEKENADPNAWKAPKPKFSKPGQKILAELQKLDKDQKIAEATAKVEEGLALPGLTDDDVFFFNQYRYNFAVSRKDMAVAEAALEAMISSPSQQMPPPQKNIAAKQLIGMAVNAKKYDVALARAERYLANNPNDSDTRRMVGTIHFVSNRFPQAIEHMNLAIAAEEAQGRTAPEDWYRIISSAYLKMDDSPRLLDALVRIVEKFPNSATYSKNWGDALRTFQDLSGLTDPISIDAYRLMRANSAISTPREYIAFAELALNRAMPGEAASILQEGQEKGIFSTGPQANAAKQIASEQLALARTRAADDKKTLPGLAKDAAASKTGTLAAALGDAYYSYDMAADAVKAYEMALAKGSLRNTEHVTMRLGLAQIKAGNLDSAKAQFAKVTDPYLARLARMWSVYASHKQGTMTAAQ
jgi:hypothetical protein